MNRSLLALIAALPFPAVAAIDFSHQVVPILKEHCAECHLGDKKKGGLSMNTRKDLMAGSENGSIIDLKSAEKSLLIDVLTTTDEDKQMPPKGKRVPAEQVAMLRQWIAEGAVWEDGFTFGKSSYEPPLKPRVVTLPTARDGRTHPIDRILDTYMAEHKVKRPAAIDDATFARRVSMDLLGLLPSTDDLAMLENDKSPNKRAQFVARLLARDVDYAEHWLTFWNDLLRNDYVGTGYIDGGRKSITSWLYQSLVSNKPYDQFARELLAPTGESEGFIFGIKWRGSVNASQVREIQFAQSVSQIFLGINMKCASCHDSFIDRWKLDEAYNLAAIYSDHPLEVNRCDKPNGKIAKPAWLFPELGDVKPDAPQPERLKQLAALMTHKDNGRFTRTIVNRLWHRLMGHGIVHPVDAMQTQPWSADLLDYLAVNLSENGYDLKKTLALIITSQAYQSQSSTSTEAIDSAHFTYAGPIAKRLTAEQFVDAVWQITGTGPKAAHGSVLRGKADPSIKPSGKWIWSNAGAKANAGDTITLRKTFKLDAVPPTAKVIVTADNEYRLLINNKVVGADTDLTTVETYAIGNVLRAGTNVIHYVAKNGGKGPNAAGAWLQVVLKDANGKDQAIATDDTWQWSTSVPDDKGKFATEPKDWQPAVVATRQDIWLKITASKIERAVGQGGAGIPAYVRASLVTSDLLQRALGRPNREQIVTVRPENLTTLEAIDLANGNILAGYLKAGATKLVTQFPNADDLIRRVFTHALSRSPSDAERTVLREVTGSKPTPQSVEDMLWSLLLLPEFQFVR